MASTSPLDYDPQEELINAYSHGLGAILAFIAVIFLIVKGYGYLWDNGSAYGSMG